MDIQNAQNMFIQEAVVDSCIEDNIGIVHQEKNTEICLLLNTGLKPAQLEEAQGYSVLNKHSDLAQSVMLTENEDEGYEHPPSKKLKTEQNMQTKEMVADCDILTQADKESENKIIEDESQWSDMDILLRTTNLLPEDKNMIYVKASSEEITTSSVEAKETTGNKGITKSKIFTADSQEQTFMDQQLKQLSDQEIYHLSQETLINTTKGPSCNHSDMEGPKEERIILQDENNMPQNQEISLNEESCGENNCFSPAKETNELETGACSERNKTVSKETSSGNNVKEIAFLLTEDKSNIAQNEPNSKAKTCEESISKPKTCEESISSDKISDDQQNHNHEGNNVTPSDEIIPPNVVDCKENASVNAAENGHEVLDTTEERNLHSFIFEHKTSWTAKLQDEVFKLVDVPCDSATYTEIKSLFKNTTQWHFQLNKIVEVQNPFLYGCYLLKKAEMKSRYGCTKEEYLFHGTKIKNIVSICEQNLDWRKHGSVTGNIFGKGASLTPISCYASHYSDKHTEEKIMFVFKVVIAHETEGNPDMVIPPYKDRFKKLRYDTAIKPNRQVVVKFSDHEFYPEYLLYYTGTYRPFVYYDYMDDSD